LDYFVQLMWDDSLQQDRFFAWAEESLIEQVRIAAHQGKFDQEHGAEVFHPGATLSYKENRFGEANVQLTFHENEKREIEGTPCVKVEPDIDYYKDPLAHALLEVVTEPYNRWTQRSGTGLCLKVDCGAAGWIAPIQSTIHDCAAAQLKHSC